MKQFIYIFILFVIMYNIINAQSYVNFVNPNNKILGADNNFSSLKKIVAREKYLRELVAKPYKKNKVAESIVYKSLFRFGGREKDEKIVNKSTYDNNGYLLNDYNCKYKYDSRYNIISEEHPSHGYWEDNIKYIFEYDSNSIKIKETEYRQQQRSYVGVYKNDGNVYTSIVQYDLYGDVVASDHGCDICIYKDGLYLKYFPKQIKYNELCDIVPDKEEDFIERDKLIRKRFYIGDGCGYMDYIYNENYNLIKVITGCIFTESGRSPEHVETTKEIYYNKNGLSDSAIEYDKEKDPIAYYRYEYKYYK